MTEKQRNEEPNKLNLNDIRKLSGTEVYLENNKLELNSFYQHNIF